MKQNLRNDLTYRQVGELNAQLESKVRNTK